MDEDHFSWCLLHLHGCRAVRIHCIVSFALFFARSVSWTANRIAAADGRRSGAWSMTKRPPHAVSDYPFSAYRCSQWLCVCVYGCLCLCVLVCLERNVEPRLSRCSRVFFGRSNGIRRQNSANARRLLSCSFSCLPFARMSACRLRLATFFVRDDVIGQGALSLR